MNDQELRLFNNEPDRLEAKLWKDAYLRFSCEWNIYLHMWYQRKGENLRDMNLPVVEF